MNIVYEGKNPKWRCYNCGTELVFTAESPIKIIKEFRFFCPKCQKAWQATHPHVKDGAIISLSRLCPFIITTETKIGEMLINRFLRCFLRLNKKDFLMCNHKRWMIGDKGFYEPHYLDCPWFKEKMVNLR